MDINPFFYYDITNKESRDDIVVYSKQFNPKDGVIIANENYRDKDVIG